MALRFSFKCIVFGYFLFTYTEKYLRVKERIYTNISKSVNSAISSEFFAVFITIGSASFLKLVAGLIGGFN